MTESDIEEKIEENDDYGNNESMPSLDKEQMFLEENSPEVFSARDPVDGRITYKVTVENEEVFYYKKCDLEYKYEKVDYTVEQDDKQITVNFTGTLTENGKVIPIEQKFVFDISRVVPGYSVPHWENQDEISEGHRDFIFYVNNIGYPDKIETPDWILNPTH